MFNFRGLYCILSMGTPPVTWFCIGIYIPEQCEIDNEPILIHNMKCYMIRGYEQVYRLDTKHQHKLLSIPMRTLGLFLFTVVGRSLRVPNSSLRCQQYQGYTKELNDSSLVLSGWTLQLKGQNPTMSHHSHFP
jgi:hypothetical protein